MNGRHVRRPNDFQRTMRALSIVMLAAIAAPLASLALMIWRHL